MPLKKKARGRVTIEDGTSGEEETVKERKQETVEAVQEMAKDGGSAEGSVSRQVVATEPGMEAAAAGRHGGGLPRDPVARKLAERAIGLVKDLLERYPKRQEDGFPFTLKEWPMEFKPTLGPYKKFLEKCGHFVIVPGSIPSMFTIVLKLPDSEGKLQSGPEWKSWMAKCWLMYVRHTPKEDRSPAEFLKEARHVSSMGVGTRPDKGRYNQKGAGKERVEARAIHEKRKRGTVDPEPKKKKVRE